MISDKTPLHTNDDVLCLCGHYGCQHEYWDRKDPRHYTCHAKGCGCERYTEAV